MLTINISSPDLKQEFRKDLLSLPIPNLRDSEKTLYNIYIYIKKRLVIKSKYNPIWWEECIELQKEFLELYERVKKKKEDDETNSRNKTKAPFYRIEGFNRGNKYIYTRLRQKSFRYLSKFGKDDEI